MGMDKKWTSRVRRHENRTTYTFICEVMAALAVGRRSASAMDTNNSAELTTPTIAEQNIARRTCGRGEDSATTIMAMSGHECIPSRGNEIQNERCTQAGRLTTFHPQHPRHPRTVKALLLSPAADIHCISERTKTSQVTGPRSLSSN